MTGESLPVDKTVGDTVSSGTVNQFGAFEMEAAKVGEDSSIQRMIRLVQSADAGKAKIVGIADRWVTWIVVIALSAAAITWAVTGQIIRAVTILVVQPVLLTGDHKNAARTIAGELQIREVRQTAYRRISSGISASIRRRSCRSA